MDYILITGVSSGIGYASTKYLLEKNFYIIGSVRSSEDADHLSNEFGKNFHALTFDITDHEQIEREAEKVDRILQGKTLSGLVNNAGIAAPGPLMHIPVEQVRYQLEVNVLGQLKVIQVFLPFLGTDRTRQGKPGRIINISSISGLQAYPFIGAYAASKHALEAISDALRLELLLYHIDVILIEPGHVDTPIWDKIPDLSMYAETDYSPLISYYFNKKSRSKKKNLSDRMIAEIIYKALTKRRVKSRYLVIRKKFRKWILPRVLPDKILSRIFSRKIEKILGKH